VKFDLYNNAGEGPDSTGLYLNSAAPTVPAQDMTSSGVDLHSQHIMAAHLSYDGTTLSMTLTDTTTNAVYSTSWPVNIPATMGSTGAYVGFTGATGSSTSTQEIVNWTYSTAGSVVTPITYQTKNLSGVSSGPIFGTYNYTGFPDATGTILKALKAGDNVRFTVNVATAGTYDVKVSIKKSKSAGIWQLAINGINLGAPVDEYNSIDGYAVVDLGSFTFPTSGNYTFQFTATGKNASSSGYYLAFDDIFMQ